MRKNIQELLISIIRDSLKDAQLDHAFSENLYLESPADTRFGDLSTNLALRLSKVIKKPPVEVAASIVDRIKDNLKRSPLKDYIKQIKVEGAGFINFYLDEGYFYEELRHLVERGRDSLRVNLGRGRGVLVEFVSANPTGPLSVAHARQAAVGDSLANILNFLRFRVKREYYLNDEGNQIDILGKTVELRIQEINGESIELPENYYQGDYVREIAKKALGRKLQGASISAYAVKYILEIIKKELDDFGVKFDCWYSQEGLSKSGKINKVLAVLKKKGFLYEQDGALWFKSREFGDDKDRVVVKSDGAYTYLAPDIAYHQGKFKRGFKWVINLWGPDHHGYIKRLSAAVKALGYLEESLSIVIVQLASISRSGKPQEMSTRRGQYITLREVLDEVGRDAARFFFLMRRTSSHLGFDIETAKKQTPENPVYYVQYAHARISSILRSSKIRIKKSVELSILKEKEEIALIKKLWQFSYILNVCLSTLDPYMLTVYLQELAETFHKFYDHHRVLGQAGSLTAARLVLIKATKIVIATGLDLLGVSKPEKM